MALDPLISKALIAFGIAAGLVCVIIVAIVVVGAVATYDPEFSPKYEAKRAEGREYGKATDQQGCMKEGLARAKGINFIDVNALTLNSGFVEECLKASRPAPGFCNGVPSFWSFKDDEWKAAQCRKAGMDEFKTGCAAVFQDQIDFCDN